MDVTPGLRITIGELVLDGVEPSDPRVAEAVRRAVAPALAQAQLPPSAADQAAIAVTDTVSQGGRR
jgi:hypothetical protein